MSEAPGRFPWVRLVLVAALVALDLWSKQAIFAWLGDGDPAMVRDPHGHLVYPLVGDWFGFMLTENRGAAWGVFEDWPWLLVGGRMIAVVVLGWMLVRSRQGWLTAALVLVLAGALGNLYDNLFREPPPDHPFGAVRDFLSLYFARWDYHFPAFNVADSCITCGAVLLIGSSFFQGSPETDEADELAETSDAAEAAREAETA